LIGSEAFMKRSQIEYVLWGTKKGDEDWEEQLIATADTTPEGKAKLEKAKAWAKQQGFDRLRVSQNDANIAPDFTKVFKK